MYDVPRTHAQAATLQPCGDASSKRSNWPIVPGLPSPWSSPVITTAAFSPRGRYQKRGSGTRSSACCVIRLARSRCCSSACGIRTLLKSSQLPAYRSFERIGGSTSWSDAVERGVALARADDGARQVVRERRRRAAGAAHAARGDGGAERRAVRARVEAGDRRRAGGRVAVGRPVELHRHAGDAGAGRARLVDVDVAVGHGGAGGREPEQPGELGVGPHRDQIAAGLDPAVEHRDLGVVQRGLAEHDDLVGRQRLRAQAAQRRDRELVEPLGAQDLRVVAAERVVRDDEDRSARPLAGAGLRGRRGRRPGAAGDREQHGQCGDASGHGFPFQGPSLGSAAAAGGRRAPDQRRLCRPSSRRPSPSATRGGGSHPCRAAAAARASGTSRPGSSCAPWRA